MNHLKTTTTFFLLAILLTVSPTFANVLGNMQTFAPNPDSLIFSNIHSSQTLEKNYFNVGLFAAYVRNEMSVYNNLVTPQYIDYRDKAFTFDAVFAWGVTRNLELTYSIPGYFKQDPDSDQTRQNFISSGVNGHRIGFKYNISQKRTGGFAVAGSADLTQTRDNPYIGNSPDPIWNLEMIYDSIGRDTGYGFNLGYRKRTPGSPANNAYFLPIADQLIASAGYVWGLSKPWRIHLETFGSYATKKDQHPDQTNISSLEVLLGGKWRLARNLWGHLGATAEALPKGLAPDYRIYIGINKFFGFGPGDTKDAMMSASTMEVLPREMVLTPFERRTVTVNGGTAPFRFELSKNMGTFSEETMEYTAGTRLGSEELIVTDGDGTRAIVPITIRQATVVSGRPLVVTPTQKTIYTGGMVQLSVSGGKGPYKTSLYPAGFGSISNLRYQAPTRTGEVEITVTDQQGQMMTSSVKVIPVPQEKRALVLSNLNFIFNTDKLTKASQKELDNNIESLSQVQINKIIVIGHTDSVGSDEYNQILSQKRAEAVAKVLRKRFGLSSEQVEAVGYGESQPIASNETENGRLKNRRVELKLYYDN